VLVCGDAFESNQVDRKTVARALEALKEAAAPVYLLPGNHDPLNAASVYRSSAFIDRKPEHVRVVESGEPIRIGEGVELVGAPWKSKRPPANPLLEVLASLAPAPGLTRICMAHGGIDIFNPDREAAGLLPLAELERALSEGKVHFVALGDRHSLTAVGGSGRIGYSGTPEATDFDEIRSGYAQIVEIGEGRVSTREVEVGKWRFIERSRVDLNGAEEIDALRRWLEAIERKDQSIVRLHLVGSLSLALNGALRERLAAAADVFAAIEVLDGGLLVMPEDADFADLGFSGFAGAAVGRLRAEIAGGGAEGVLAGDALMLLMRLARGKG
jgi:DNA repair exonuclease SbcCD nuclease subunit